jgi:glyoxylase-like metal-dependent hydrolase (beta-lactamase superfamily II)
MGPHKESSDANRRVGTVFWKRKGKKKDGGEAGGAGAASATVTTEAAEEPKDTATTGDAAAAASAADAKDTADAKDATDTAGAVADGKAAPDPVEPAPSDGDAAPDAGGEPLPAAEGVGPEPADAPDAASAFEDDDADPEADPAGTVADADADAERARDADTDGADGSATDADAADDADEADDEDKTVDTAAAPAREPEVPGVDEPDADGVQRVRTAGTLVVDDEEFDVVSNTWIVDADDEGVIVIDPAHDAEAIMAAVGDREVYLVACTNGYNTHIASAIKVAERDEAPIALHRRELRPWRRLHGAEHRPDLEIEGGGALQAGDLEIDILPVPGTAAGSVAYYISERGVVFTGDSLRAGELGTVGGVYIDYTRQLHSIGEVILSLPPDTRVLPDSGPATTCEAESKNFDSWVSAD